MQKYIYELAAEPRLLDVPGLMLEYQYAVSRRRRRAVVNLSRRQTLIKIFTKYLPTANRNISAIFTKQNPRVSSPTLCNLASIPGQFEIDYIGYLLPGKPHTFSGTNIPSLAGEKSFFN